MEEAENKKENKKKRGFKTIDLAYIGIFAALIAVCSWIQIPLTIPITLQTMGVCIATGLLGTKRGTLSVVVYILLGLIGLPVFAGFESGVGTLFGMKGGYIIGFIFTALIVGIMVKLLGKKVWVYALSMVIGIIVCYAFGTAWFMVIYTRDVEAISLAGALGMCVTPFIIPDLVKIAVATLLCSKLNRFIK